MQHKRDRMVYVKGIGKACFELLRRTQWTKSHAASVIGVSNTTFHAWLAEVGGWREREGFWTPLKTHGRFVARFQQVYRKQIGKSADLIVE